MKHPTVYWLTCVLMVLFACAASATTIVMPTDEQLIEKSPVIVEGKVARSGAVERGNEIWTETVVDVTRVHKGEVGSTVTIREIGGELDDRITKVFGNPEYTDGQRVLVFLAPTPRGDYQTMDLFIGKFTEKKSLGGDRLWTRNDTESEAVLLDGQFQPLTARSVQRDAAGFEQFIRERVAGRKGNKIYAVENPVLDEPGVQRAGGRTVEANFELIDEPTIYRWFAFDSGRSASWFSHGTQTGYADGGVAETRTAMAAWVNYSGARIRYVYSGKANGNPGTLSAPNGVNEVIFGDPRGEIAGTWNPNLGGVVGKGGFNGARSAPNWTSPFAADGAHPKRTFQAFDITEGNLVIQDGVSPQNRLSSGRLSEILSHELGHTLGFGHSADNTALMYANVTGLGPSLREDDQLAARWLYPSGSNVEEPAGQVPAAPTTLTGVPAGTSVALDWRDNANNETGFNFYVGSGTSGALSKVAQANADSTSGTLNGFAPGVYRISITAFNATGESGPSNTITVTIGNGLSAGFTANQWSGVAGQTNFQFSDQSTGTITARQWNFGDGATASGSNVSHVYQAAGSYAIVLTITGTGGSSQATNVVTVQAAPQQPLSAAFSFNPSLPTTEQNITFTDQSTGGVTSWLWNFGDGTSSSSTNPVKRYSSAGSFNVTLTAFRGQESSTAAKTVVVTAGVPATPTVNVNFDFAPLAPVSGDAVRFTDLSSGGPTAWSWSFGDGTTSSVQHPTHVFEKAGMYTVTLRVENSISSSTTSRTISVAQGLTPYRSLISVTAQTDGVGGSVWRTELSIFNAGTDGANVSLIFIPGAGSSVQTRTLFLGPKQSAVYPNALLDIYGMASGAGAIAIEASSPISSPNLKLSSRTFTNSTRGTYGQAVPDVFSSDLEKALYLTGLESSSDYRTNIGLVNKSGSPVMTVLGLYDSTGGLIGSTTVTVPASNFQQLSLGTLFSAITGHSLRAMALRVSSSVAGAVSAYASVVDNRTQDPVYVQATPEPTGGRMTLPAVGRAPGANNTFWRSDVTFFNPSNDAITLSMRFLPAGSDNRNATSRNVVLGAGRSQVIADVLAYLGLTSGSGALELTWNGSRGPVVTSRTYTTVDGGGTFGQSIDPVTDFARDVYVPGLRSDASFRSNVGFVNSSDETIGVNVTLLSATGVGLTSAFVTLAPKSQLQYPVATLFPNVPASTLGTFTLEAHTATPALFVYGSIVDNASGDPVFFAGK